MNKRSGWLSLTTLNIIGCSMISAGAVIIFACILAAIIFGAKQ